MRWTPPFCPACSASHPPCQRYYDELVDRIMEAEAAARARVACLAMARIAAWAWCEGTAHREAGAWNPMEHEGNDAPWMRRYRQRALAMAIEAGVLRMEWTR